MVKRGDIVRLNKYLGDDSLLKVGDLLEVATLTKGALICNVIEGCAEGDTVVLLHSDIEKVSTEEMTLAALTDDPVGELWKRLRVVARDEDLQEVKRLVKVLDLYR